MKKKIVGILVCMLMIVPVLATTAAADPGPEFEIELKSGLGVNIIIRNIGDEDAIDIEGWVKVYRDNSGDSGSNFWINAQIEQTDRFYKKTNGIFWNGHRLIDAGEIFIRIGYGDEPYYMEETFKVKYVLWFVLVLPN